MARWLLILSLMLGAGPAWAAHPAAAGARQGLADQMAAWNRGDLEAALDRYWNSPDIVWVTRSGLSKGFADFAAGMRAEFAGKPEKMGSYRGEILEARDLAEDKALLVVRWSITRGAERLMGGVSTQIWQRIDGRWRIVLEHAG